MKVSAYCNAAIYQGKAGIIGILHDGKNNKKKVYDQFKNSNEDLAVQAAIIRTLRELKKPQNTDVTIHLPRKIQLNHPKLKNLLRQLKSYTVKIDLEKLYKTIQQEEIELAKKQGESVEDVKVGVGFLLINNGPAGDKSAPKGKVLICNEEFGNEENFLPQSSLGM